MDAIEALDRTAEHWQWLAETGSPHKGDWPGFRGVPLPPYYCFLCEYTGSTTDCVVCPLYGKWGTALRCNGYGSPFSAWAFAKSDKEHKRAAQAIVDLCRAEAKRLREERP